MANLAGNSQVYNIHAENEVAEILSNFETEFIRRLVEESLTDRFNYIPSLEKVNMVQSLEQNFKTIVDRYVEEQANIYEVRTNTYMEIIEIIAMNYNLDIRREYSSPSGNHTEAFWMYDFFVGNFIRRFVQFIASIIKRDAVVLYNAIPADKRDTSVYKKKVYAEDMQLGVIMDNLNQVVDTVMYYDFTLADILQSLYGVDTANAILSTVYDKGDFYKTFYASLMQTSMKAQLISDIRLTIHADYVSSHNVPGVAFGQI